MQPFLGKRREERRRAHRALIDPAARAFDQALVFAAANGHMLHHLGKLDVLAPTDATDQQGQRVEMTFLMAARPNMQRVRQGPFTGTIVTKVGVHRESSCLMMILNSEDSRCTPAFMQVARMPCAPNALIFSVR
jgi:hypothetical protein